LANLKAKKQAKGKTPKGAFPWFLWLAIALGIVAIVALSCASPTSGPTASNQSGEFKAAIIDQLYSLQPNEAFIQQTTHELEAYGFEVDLYQGDEVTVDLYRSLAGSGYKLILFRAHSGLLSGEGEVINKTCLFTNELYSETEHVKEQLSDQLARARIDKNHPFVFSIRDEFVTRSMKGEFDDTVIIMMGCSCLYVDDLARAFIDKGASVYLAWDATVDLGYVDRASAHLMQQLCGEEMPIGKAVISTMDAIGPDPKYGAVLKYYPAQTGDKILEELIQEPG